MESAGQPCGLLYAMLSAEIDVLSLYFLFALHLYVRDCRVRLFRLLHGFVLSVMLSSTGTIKSIDAIPKDTTRFH